MASKFAADFLGGAWSVLADAHGESVTITPRDDTLEPTTLTAIFERGAVLDDGFSGDAHDQRRSQNFGVLKVLASDFEGWTPVPGDAVAIGSFSFVVGRRGELVSGIWKAQLNKSG